MNNLLIGSENIDGNIGSCSVVNTDFKVDSFTEATIQTNSCTGEVISQHEFTNPGVLMLGWIGAALLLWFVVWVVVELVKSFRDSPTITESRHEYNPDDYVPYRPED